MRNTFSNASFTNIEFWVEYIEMWSKMTPTSDHRWHLIWLRNEPENGQTAQDETPTLKFSP